MADISGFIEREKNRSDILSLNVKHHDLELNILFICDRKTFLFAVKGKNIAWQPPCEDNWLKEFVPKDVFDEIKYLYVDKDNWSNKNLFNKIANILNINEKINRDTEINKELYLKELKKTKTTDPKYGKDGNKPYFWRFKKANPSPENLSKIKVNLGQEVFDICKENKITVDWSDDTTKNIYKPISDILKEVDEKIMPNLQENKIDKVVKGLKITSSLCPYAGGLFSEIITNIIPNQRIDRMVEFLKILDTKLSKYGESMANLEKKLEKPESIELFEEAMWQSSRAISKERKEYIASILAKGLSNDQLEEIQNSVLLNILSQLNDNEIIILSSYIYKNMVNNEFKSKYENVLHVPLAYIGADKDLLAKNTVCSIYREKLFNLSLLRKRFKKPKKDTLPEFDEKTGMMKSSSYEITYLGSLFLDYIGLESDHSEN